MTTAERTALLLAADAMDALHGQGIEGHEEWKRRWAAHAKAASDLRALAQACRSLKAKKGAEE